ncbi:MAG: hypothetical protein C5B49_08990 [Bdellovibrio sp.]|nr:MAG: hypothetical protein C5B49_08990 [Bdellovibrio sp.]
MPIPTKANNNSVDGGTASTDLVFAKALSEKTIALINFLHQIYREQSSCPRDCLFEKSGLEQSLAPIMWKLRFSSFLK